MQISWLEDFLALAATRNFSRAAEQRHMTQPAFSRRIRALEEWLGVPLCDRGVQPVLLTEAGEWFRSVAEDLLQRVDQIPETARAMSAANAAALRIAVTHALSLTFVPNWLRGLEATLELGPMHLLADVAERCEALLMQGRVQFLLCHTHALLPTGLDGERFARARVGQDQLIPVAAPGEGGRPRHSLGASGKQPGILHYSAESGLGRIVRSVHGATLERIRAEAIVTAHLATLLRSMALAGRGVAWLPHSLIADDLTSGRLLPAADERWTIPVEVSVFRDRTRLPAAAEAFWAACAGL